MLIVYEIRNYINKTKGKEILVYLTNKFKLELLKYLQKEKNLYYFYYNKNIYFINIYLYI